MIKSIFYGHFERSIMKKIIDYIKYDVLGYVQYNIIGKIKSYFYVKKYKKLYLDWEDNEYNCGDTKFIWGIKSWDDLTGKDCNFYTMNDIDITYDRKTKEYYIGIETAYMFQGNRKEEECKYLRQLLDAFTKFMDNNSYPKDDDYCLFMTNPSISTRAKSIEELYTNFRIFVEGFCKLYEV
jgi:hypothetical protein